MTAEGHIGLPAVVDIESHAHIVCSSPPNSLPLQAAPLSVHHPRMLQHLSERKTEYLWTPFEIFYQVFFLLESINPVPGTWFDAKFRRACIVSLTMVPGQITKTSWHNSVSETNPFTIKKTSFGESPPKRRGIRFAVAATKCCGMPGLHVGII